MNYRKLTRLSRQPYIRKYGQAPISISSYSVGGGQGVNISRLPYRLFRLPYRLFRLPYLFANCLPATPPFFY